MRTSYVLLVVSSSSVAPLNALLSPIHPNFIPQKRQRCCSMSLYATRQNSSSPRSSIEDQRKRLRDKFNVDIQSEADTYGADRANELLTIMIESMKHGVRPDYKSYSIVFNAYADATVDECAHAGDKALRLLEEVKENSDIVLDFKIYNAVLRAITVSSKFISREFAENANDLLCEMEDAVDLVYNSPSCTLRPNLDSYELVIHALCRNGMTTTAENLVQKMLERKQMYGNDAPSPSLKIFHEVAFAYSFKAGGAKGRNAQKKIEDCARRVDSLIHLMENEGIVADSKMYNACISCWSKVGSISAVETSDLRLNEIVTKLEARGGDEKEIEISKLAHCFHDVLAGWSKSGFQEAGLRAEKIIILMTRLHEAGYAISPNVVSYNIAISAWAKSLRSVYNIALRADNLFDRMKKNVVPSVHTYCSLIDAWINCNDMCKDETAERANGILRNCLQSNEMNPEKRLYTAVIKANARAGNSNYCYNLLNEMCDLYESGHEDAKPDVMTYTEVINAYSNSHVTDESVDRCMALIKRMEMTKYEDNPTLPTAHTFSALLNVVAKSRVKNKVALVKNTINHMDEILTIPSVRALNNAINACSSLGTADSQTRKEGLILSTSIFKKIHQSSQMELDSFSYGYFIKSISNLTEYGSSKRNKMLCSIFEQCQRDKQTSKHVLYQLQRALPREIFDNLPITM